MKLEILQILLLTPGFLIVLSLLVLFLLAETIWKNQNSKLNLLEISETLLMISGWFYIACRVAKEILTF